MLNSRFARFSAFFVTSSLALNAHANFQISRDLNGLEVFANTVANDPAKLQEDFLVLQRLMSGDVSDLVAVDKVIAKASRGVGLVGAQEQDVIVALSLPAKLVMQENAAQSSLEITVMSTEGAVDASNIQIQRQGNTYAVQGSMGSGFCAMAAVQGVVMSMKGTCAVALVQVAPGGRVKVYLNGKFSAKSLAARLSFDDVTQAFASSSSDGTKILNEYLKQDGAKLSEAQIKEIVSSLRGPSYKVNFLRSAVKTVGSLSGETVFAIIDDIAGPSYKIDALRILKDKALFNGADLVRVVGSISGSSYKNDALRLLAASTQFNEGDVQTIISDVSGPSYKIDALRTIVPGLKTISGSETARIISDVSGPSYKVDALRVLISKVPAADREALSRFALDELPGSYAKDAVNVVLGR